MYLEHYGLNEPPFRITPHTEFFYAGANRGATLEALLYAVLHGEGLVRVTGEVGAGKTMLCRVLMERLPEQVDTVYLANPSLSREEILLAIAADLKLDLPADRPNVLIRSLQDALVARYAAGRQVVVLIDEAHAMPEESLEEIRLLSNLEHGHNKLLQIVLFGQPELNDKLAAQNMRQLRERITHAFELAPLRQHDIGEYLMFRLRTAGYKGPDIFTARAVRLIADESEGLTRRINILADKALIASFAANRHQVDVAEARAAITDSNFRQRKRIQWSRPALGLGLLLAGMASGLAASHWISREPPAPGASATPAAGKPAAPAREAATPVAATAASPAAASSALPGNDADSLFDSRLKASEAAFARQAPGTFTILLSVAPQTHRADLAQFMAQTARKLPVDQLFAYPTRTRQGIPHFGLTYGLYDS
ncbi:ExeA family protein, partial [Chitinimonas sp.]|uniref:ExeA family protein n=1 Tax=Chitinimonas sp. TaxID=1934313 RepID=UPI0035B02914